MYDDIRSAATLMAQRSELTEEAITALAGRWVTGIDRLSLHSSVKLLIVQGKQIFKNVRQPLRWSDVRRQTQNVLAASAELREELVGLKEFLLQCHNGLFVVPNRPSNLDLLFDIRSAGKNSGCNNSETVARLFALEAFCRDVIGRVSVHRGGRATVRHSYEGNPKALIVAEAGRTFMQHRPDKMTGSADGPFCEFVGFVYEILTGEEADAPGVGLKRYVAHVAPRLRKLEILKSREKRLADWLSRGMTIIANNEDLSETRDIIHTLERELRLGPK